MAVSSIGLNALFRTRDGPVIGVFAYFPCRSFVLRTMQAMVLGFVGMALSSCGNDHTLITIDGSSTAFPLTAAIAEDFRDYQIAHLSVSVSGTRRGLDKLCTGAVGIATASRPITAEENQRCIDHGIRYIELPVAYDGIAMIVNRDNDWVDALTLAELRQIWTSSTQGGAKRWSDLRPDWPNRPINLFGPGPDSGTFDSFTSALFEPGTLIRPDFTTSEHDNAIMQGVALDRDALGYVGFAYVTANQDHLRVVPIDDENDNNGPGAVEPSLHSLRDGRYQPLTRPLFLYVAQNESYRPHVHTFIDFYLERSPTLAQAVGYAPLSLEAYVSVRRRFGHRIEGSMFLGSQTHPAVTVERLLAASEMQPTHESPF